PLVFLVLIAVMVAVVAGVIIMTLGQRKIPVQYAKRVVGRRVYGGQSTHIPLRVNTAGVIPVIFASSIIAFPTTIAQFVHHPWAQAVTSWLHFGGLPYTLIYAGGIIFFTYFYTAIIFNPSDVADNMKKYGGYIPGIRPGKKTAEYIDFVLSRITFGGALYLAAVSILPTILINQFGVPFYFGGTGLLIVVGVALDTVQQIEGHLITRHYEGFTGPRGPRIRGRAAVSA
ncbi:MAG TPA: SecY family transport protein, partial [Anaeromyxobacteraceae bacterium]|nr:SecY family transport protein [Anaeromyxobacteraceae bacterium]